MIPPGPVLAPQRVHLSFSGQPFRMAMGLTARIAADPAIAGELAGAVRALPAELALYKSIPPIRDALPDYLDARASA
jgi:hypothetical protein